MKTIYFLCFLVLSVNAVASYTICPAHIAENPKYQRAWSFLKQLKPRMTFDKCEIELHICDTAAVGSDDNIIGDIAVKNQKGDSYYATLIFPSETDKNVHVNVDADKNWVHYRVSDRNADIIDGAYQRTKLDIITRGGVVDLKRLSLSVYSSNEHDTALGIVPVSFQSICEE